MAGATGIEQHSDKLLVDTEITPGRVLSPSGQYCWGVSRRSAVIGFQQPAQTLDANDLALVLFVLRLDDPVGTLVNSLMMIVLEILG